MLISTSRKNRSLIFQNLNTCLIQAQFDLFIPQKNPINSTQTHRVKYDFWEFIQFFQSFFLKIWWTLQKAENHQKGYPIHIIFIRFYKTPPFQKDV